MTGRNDIRTLLTHLVRGLVIFISSLVFYMHVAHAAAEDPVQILKSGDVERASKLLKDLADKGDRDAQYALGVIHYRGDLGKVDNEAATGWFRKAAEQNHLEAIFNLGIAYWEGRGVEQNFSESFSLWRRAAELNYPPAQHNLATVYYMGKGTAKDLPLAIAWFNRAAENGHSEARQILKTLRESSSSVVATSSGESATMSSGESTATSSTESNDAMAALSATDQTVESETKDVMSDQAAVVYASPDADAPGIGEYTSTRTPTEIGREDGWVQVIVPSGALVWVYGTFVEASSGGDATSAAVTGTSVRMRPSPSTGPESQPLGSFAQGEMVEIVEERGEWKRVRIAGPLAGWLRSDDFENL